MFGKIKQPLKKFIWQMDMFSVNPTLRSRDQPYSSTPFLGFISILILGIFIALFVNNLIAIARKDSDTITVTNNFQISADVKKVNNIMFGVSFQRIRALIQTVDDLEKYFMMTAKIKNQTIVLKPCNVSNWKIIGDNYENIFKQYLLNTFYCPTDLVNITTTSPQIFLSIQISKCDPQYVRDCQPQANIQQYYNRILQRKGGFFPVYMYFLNPYAQVKSPEPLKYFVRVKRLASSRRKSATYFIKYDEFKITTDTNLWPLLQTIEQQTGLQPVETFYAYKDFQTSSELVNNKLVTVNCYASQNLNIYSRSISKLDNVLSYVGGLFGALSIILLFFLSRYNQYRYQLRVGQSTFNFNDTGHKVYQSDLNFWTFLKYTIFHWLNLIFYVELPWQRTKQMSDTLKQSRQILNVEKLFRRLQYLQSIVWNNNDENFLRVMTLIQHKSIDQVQKNRRILQYYQEVNKTNAIKKSITVRDALEQNDIAVKYMKRLYKMYKKKNIKKEQAQTTILKELNLKQQNKVDYEQTEDKIYQSLMVDLQLYHYPQLCQRISEHIQIAKQAKELKLKQGFLQTEKQLTKAFLSIPEDVKANLIMKISIKILHRLRFCARQINKDKPKINISPKKQPRKSVAEIFMDLGLQSQQEEKDDQ